MSNTAFQSMAVAVQANENALMIGEPGTGKTSMAEALGRRLDRFVVTITGTTSEPQDLGIPVIQANGGTRKAAPAYVLDMIEEAAKGRSIMWIVDELSCATPAMQSGFLRAFQERVVGETPLPLATGIVGIMNPPEIAANGSDLAAPLANRFPHMPWSFDHDGWIKWLLSNGTHLPDYPVVPKDWQAGIAQERVLVAGFNKAKITAALAVPKTDAERGRAWPSPRTWDMVARLRAAALAAHAPAEVLLMLTCGAVGQGMGTEYAVFLDNLDLPDIEALIAKPQGWEVPARGDKTFTILASVGAAVEQKMTKDRYLAAWTLFNAAAQAGQKDVAAHSVVQMVSAAWGKTTKSKPQPWLGEKAVCDVMNVNMKPFTAILQAAGLMKGAV